MCPFGNEVSFGTGFAGIYIVYLKALKILNFFGEK